MKKFIISVFKVKMKLRMQWVALAALSVLTLGAVIGHSQTNPAEPRPFAAADFPKGTATPPEECGVCHKAIYREFATGFGSDLRYGRIVYQSAQDKILTLPERASSSPTLHAVAGVDPFPIHAREIEEEGKSCNVCHFPQAFAIPDLETLELTKPVPRPKGEESGGLTCASCHLTPDGKIRGPHAVVDAPHATVADPKMQTSVMCAYCNAGLGAQHCQDCHMPRTLRKTAEDFDVPVRAVGRHLWTGGHSTQRLHTAMNLVIVQPSENTPAIELHVINIGAGHSVPTGSNRRGIFLHAEIVDAGGKTVASNEWMFAPWYGNRPDDRAFIEEDKKRPDAVAATMADAQGPHEPPVRAGEERILTWTPEMPLGQYTVRACLIYDLNRYNDRAFSDDQTEIGRAKLAVTVKP